MMDVHGNDGDMESTQEHESEAALLLRLEALEQRVFGRSRMAHHEMSDFHSKVDTLAKQLSRLEGGSRELREVAQQASSLGVLIHPVNMVSPSVETVALKENILLASRGEIEETSQLLDAAKDLESHVNPSYLQDIPKFAQKLSKMEGTHVGQVADATLIDERAESTRLHYNLAISLISEKFVHWDDQVAALERGMSLGSTNASS